MGKVRRPHGQAPAFAATPHGHPCSHAVRTAGGYTTRRSQPRRRAGCHLSCAGAVGSWSPVTDRGSVSRAGWRCGLVAGLYRPRSAGWVAANVVEAHGPLAQVPLAQSRPCGRCAPGIYLKGKISIALPGERSNGSSMKQGIERGGIG